jgi:hypothetical protein
VGKSKTPRIGRSETIRWIPIEILEECEMVFGGGGGFVCVGIVAFDVAVDAAEVGEEGDRTALIGDVD